MARDYVCRELLIKLAGIALSRGLLKFGNFDAVAALGRSHEVAGRGPESRGELCSDRRAIHPSVANAMPFLC